MASQPQLAAGSDVDSFCGKCQLDLAHIVVACQPGRAARVQCKTCGAQHAMRKPKSAATKKKRTSKAGAAPSPKSARGKLVQAFSEASAGKDLTRSESFSIKRTFAEGDVLSHATFGIGIVLKATIDKKIDVLFENAGLKILAHARS